MVISSRRVACAGCRSWSWSRPLGRPALGVALPDGARALRALEQQARSAAQKLTDWARQAILQTKRWLPDRRLIIVADASFAALDLIAALRRQVCLITRLRIDASLFAPAPPRQLGQIGRPRLKGQRLPKFVAMLVDPETAWSPINLTEWYGGQQRRLEILSGIAVWYCSGLPPAQIRWVLVHDPSGEREPQAFLSTDLMAKPEQIIGWFVSRWRMETTFQETRTHLGMETQRQWSDLAILRTTPALLGLFSLITVWADRLARTPAGLIVSMRRRPQRGHLGSEDRLRRSGSAL